jgi:hypothetical protein
MVDVFPQVRHRDLDGLRLRHSPKLRPASVEEIPALLSFAASEVPGIQASSGVVRRVQEANPKSILVIEDRNGVSGVIALLLFNTRGLEALLAGELCFANPDPSQLAAPNDPLAAIYVWILCARGKAAAAVGEVMQWAQRDGRENANIYARPTTPQGERFMSRCGFQSVRCGQTDLWRYSRLSLRHLPKNQAA